MQNIFPSVICFYFFLVTGAPARSQNMTGLTKPEIQKQMAALYPKYSVNSFGISTNLNTLKYVDSNSDRTLIFYFNNDNTCKYSKLIEDIDVIKYRIAEYNKKYKQSGDLAWTETARGKKYRIYIEKEKYIFSTITIE